MSIWAHTIVRNEERYIWYAVMSVIDWVDKILIWDTGSTDRTVSIVHELQQRAGGKIEFQEVGQVTKESFTQKRQAMLEATTADWILLVDGDEVWSEAGLKELRTIIEQKNPDAVISPFWSIVGDIYHYQEEKAGRYSIGGRIGHLTIRAFRRDLLGLHAAKPFHSGEGFYDKSGKSLQEQKNLVTQKEKFFHFGNLRRSCHDSHTMGRNVVYEQGLSFPRDFYYPEVFFKPHPAIVPSPWQKLSGPLLLKAKMETPLRFWKRKIWM